MESNDAHLWRESTDRDADMENEKQGLFVFSISVSLDGNTSNPALVSAPGWSEKTWICEKCGMIVSQNDPPPVSGLLPRSYVTDEKNVKKYVGPSFELMKCGEYAANRVHGT